MTRATGEPPPPALNRLIHEPARLLLVSNLYVVEEADFVYLSRRTGLTDGNISSHMARLQAAGYIEVDKMFVDNRPRTVYRLTMEGRTAFERYREDVEGILGADYAT